MISATQSNHPLAVVTTQSTRSDSPLHAALERIRQANMRITKPRIAIIEVMQGYNGPVTIERIHQDIGTKICDLVTVYRCLLAFEEIALVRRSYQHTGTCLYELSVNTPRHSYLMCKACNKTERVDYFPVEGMERLLTERGYTQLSHVVEFFGICPACQQQAPTRQIAPTLTVTEN